MRLERTSSLCRLNRRHQPQMGEPDSNGWSGTPGDSPQPTHTICVLYQVLYFSEKILGENLVKRSQWTRTTIRSAQICNAESNRFASGNQSRTSFVPLLYHTLRGLSRGFSKLFEKFFRRVAHRLYPKVFCLELSPPLDTLIVSQLGRFVKGFFTFFSKSGASVDLLPSGLLFTLSP